MDKRGLDPPSIETGGGLASGDSLGDSDDSTCDSSFTLGAPYHVGLITLEGKDRLIVGAFRQVLRNSRWPPEGVACTDSGLCWRIMAKGVTAMEAEERFRFEWMRGRVSIKDGGGLCLQAAKDLSSHEKGDAGECGDQLR
jgi:hypothetical protein